MRLADDIELYKRKRMTNPVNYINRTCEHNTTYVERNYTTLSDCNNKHIAVSNTMRYTHMRCNTPTVHSVKTNQQLVPHHVIDHLF